MGRRQVTEHPAELPRFGVGNVLGALAPMAAWAAGILGLHPGVWTTALGAVGAALVSAASVAWAVQYRYFAVVLRDAAKRKGSHDRQPYERLRQRLDDQGLRLIYEARLTAALAWLERALGDAGVADNSWAARRFALPGEPPLWTARSYDRCLLLALIYPVFTIMILWVVTGHQGPAEASLGLEANVGPAWRMLSVGVLPLLFYGLFRSALGQATGWFLVWVAFAWASISLTGASAAVSSGIAGVVGGAALILVGGAGVGFGAIAFAVAFGGAIDRAVSGPTASTFGGALALAFTVAAVVAAAVMSKWSRPRGWESWFLLSLTVAGLLASWLAVPMAASRQSWDASGPLVLFLGVLTFVNAPFDWLSIGLTRGLLRCGLVWRGWWAYGFALLDAVAATVLIAALAVAMVLAVQAFDGLAVRVGGEPTLPLDALLRGLREHPSEPEYFWVYATLFSTIIPSLINLFIAGWSLLQGMPWLRRKLAQ